MLDLDEMKVSGKQVVVVSKLAHSVYFDIGEKRIKINGQNEGLRGKPEGILTIGGVGYTVVEADLWEAIAKEYANMPAIKDGFISAEKNKASAKDKGKDIKEMKNGLEPVDTKKTATREDKEK